MTLEAESGGYIGGCLKRMSGARSSCLSRAPRGQVDRSPLHIEIYVVHFIDMSHGSTRDLPKTIGNGDGPSKSAHLAPFHGSSLWIVWFLAEVLFPRNAGSDD